MGIKHKRQKGASRFARREARAGPGRKGKERQKTAFRVSYSSAHSGPLAPGQRQAALMSLERSDARMEGGEGAKMRAESAKEARWKPKEGRRGKRCAKIFAKFAMN
jgi:hypothetical protein